MSQTENQYGNTGCKLHVKLMHSTSILRTFHPTGADYTSFSNIHGRFFRIDHTSGYRTSPNKFRRIEVISSTFTNHNSMKFKVNNERNPGKCTNMGK
jgi:hypothetical protein